MFRQVVQQWSGQGGRNGGRPPQIRGQIADQQTAHDVREPIDIRPAGAQGDLLGANPQTIVARQRQHLNGRGQEDGLGLGDQKDHACRMFGDDGGNDLGVTGITAKIHRYRPHIVYIDGAYLINDDRGGKAGWERFGNVCQDLKRMAQREKIPVVVTHQFNAEGKGMDGSEETLKYGDVQMWFDLILGCYQSEDLRENKEMLIKILKHREGEKLKMVSEWDLENMSFEYRPGEDDLQETDTPYDQEEPVKF